MSSVANRNSVGFYPSWLANAMTIKNYKENGEVSLIMVNTQSVPHLNIDRSLLNYEKLHLPNSFTIVQEELTRLEERSKEIQELRRIRELAKIAREEDRKHIQQEMKQATQQAQIRKKQQDEETKRRQLEDTKKNEIVQKMMVNCEGLNDPNSARFYLESQQWNLEEAISLYCGSTGKKDQRKKETTINVNFVLPDQRRISHRFEPKSLMWNMLAIIYQAVQCDREFVVSSEPNRNDISIDTMTNTSFEQARVCNDAVLYVRFL